MEARLVELGALLRQNGIRVSPAEIADAAAALGHAGVGDRETVRAALKATLCKRARDEARFDQVFELYFSGLRDLLAGVEASLLRRIEEEGVLEGDELEMLLYTLREMGQQISPLARALLEGDAGAMARLLRGSALQLDFGQVRSPLEEGFFARRLTAGAGLHQARNEFAEIERRLRERGVDARRVELLAGKMSERLREVEEAARRYVAAEARARRAEDRDDAATPQLRAFQALQPEELERTERAVRRLAEKLRSRLRRRERSRRKGALNALGTLRRNMALGGVPARLVFRRRRVEKSDLVVLCDVSESVRNVSRLMLLFLHTLQARFAKVRSFVFVSEVGEVTEAFEQVDASRAVDLAVAGKAIHVYGNSNYGRAFAHFARDHLDAVTRRTTVLIIGDGRNNYNAANLWALEAIRRKARRTLWICPEDRAAWAFGDSEMHLYESAVDQVLVAQNLHELEELAEKIVR